MTRVCVPGDTCKWKAGRPAPYAPESENCSPHTRNKEVMKGSGCNGSWYHRKKQNRKGKINNICHKIRLKCHPNRPRSSAPPICGYMSLASQVGVFVAGPALV
eukprot:1385225-Amorphochlora_amoeboformis.AAC.1